MRDEQANRKDAKKKGRKRTREGGSQTDEEDATGICTRRQPCGQCSVAMNSRLSSIEEKLNLHVILTVLPELESYKSRINQLEEENTSQSYKQVCNMRFMESKLKTACKQQQRNLEMQRQTNMLNLFVEFGFQLFNMKTLFYFIKLRICAG